MSQRFEALDKIVDNYNYWVSFDEIKYILNRVKTNIKTLYNGEDIKYINRNLNIKIKILKNLNL